jgi:hypothetical protein
MSDFITLSDCALARDKIAYILRDAKDYKTLRVQFVGVDQPLVIEGLDALELWKEFGDGDWREG